MNNPARAEDPLLTRFRQTLQKTAMLRPGDRVTVALSGGADSMTLLWLLFALRQELSLSLYAAHLNHGLRGAEADRDEALVRRRCEQLGVPLTVRRVDLPALCQPGEGVEAAGRRVRYAFLEEAEPQGLIATAHNANDNAETVLMHLLRGSGLTGLCGIAPVRGRIIRPLLGEPRDEILACCERQGIPFAEDSTNGDERYLRNALRRRLLPQFTRHNPAFLQAVERLTESARRDLHYLQSAGETLLQNAALPGGYSVAVLLAAHPAPRAYALRQALAGALGQTPEAAAVDRVEALLQTGGRCSLPGGCTAAVLRGRLSLAPPPTPPESLCLPVAPGERVPVRGGVFELTPGGRVCNLLTTNALDCDTIGQHLHLRHRQSGDAITLPARRCTKSLKKLFSEMGLTAAERAQRLVLCDETGLLWVEGVGCDARCAVSEHTRRTLTPRWLPATEHKEEPPC